MRRICCCSLIDVLIEVSKLCILVVQWSQTAEDVTVILHAGRPLKHSDIEVVFSDDRVNVGLTGNHFLQTINTQIEAEPQIQAGGLRILY